MNIPLLLRVKRHILRYPEKFRMDAWNCGTAQCIAGRICSLSGESWKPLKLRPPWSTYQLKRTRTVPGRASHLLGLAEVASFTLFYECEWPARFKSTPKDSRTRRAAKAAARIDEFIATGH